MLIPRNEWDRFVHFTIATGDLDPMYIMMHKLGVEYGDAALARFALHFFLFYDAGEAAKCLHDDREFWRYVHDEYPNMRRGTERRHFRGARGLAAIKGIEDHGSPRTVWEHLHEETYTGLVLNIQRNFPSCEIGPYFTWKAMDLLDRCFDKTVKLNLDEVKAFMPDQPRKCAKEVFPHQSVSSTVAEVADSIKTYPAPGVPTRSCGYAEAETILCMAKGFFLTRSHTPGDDIDEKRVQLKGFPDLLALLPPRASWSDYVRSLDPQAISA